MGLRFDLQTVNWLAHVLDERMPIPSLGAEWLEREALRMFLSTLEEGFVSSPRRMYELREVVNQCRSFLEHGKQAPTGLLADLRRFLGGRPWTALIVPAGDSQYLDRVLCSKDFLRFVVSIRTEDPGLILQLEDPPQKVFSLMDVFPAFQTALAASTEWPGILIWTQNSDSVFLPLPSTERAARDQARWIFSHLSISVGLDLALLKQQYYREFFGSDPGGATCTTIVHISDVHLGSREAAMRLPRVQNMLANLVNDLGHLGDSIIPLVTGDLMDSPAEANLDRVRSFLEVLSQLGTEEPIVLLGNHDVRSNGYLADNFRSVMQIESGSGVVRWFEHLKLGIACFDSVREGNLARGQIGERQFLDVGSRLDSKCGSDQEYLVIAALHHHPLPVNRPDWYAERFYDRLLGTMLEKTLELEDAADFVAFIEERQIAAILHGHKHIPRVDFTPKGVPVIGCGSTVGKVTTRDGRPFMSINLLSINQSSGRIAARLLAERIPGGGLNQYMSHELVCAPQSTRGYRVNRV